MRIALIFNGNVNYQSGKFNHVFRRLQALKEIEGVHIDAFIIQKKYTWLFHLLKKIGVTPGSDFIKDGISIKNLWIRQSLVELIKVNYLKISPLSCKKQLNKYINIFKSYDLISTNDTLSSFLAYQIKAAYGIPFVITWHGSDINIYPFKNRRLFILTKSLMEKADFNLFVSKKLLSTSAQISDNCKKDYYYIGPANAFANKSIEEKKMLKNRYELNSKYVVGYVGNMLPIKNVLILPEVFHLINQEIDSVIFVLVGAGRQLDDLKKKMDDCEIDNIKFFGNVPPEEMPDIMNTLDLLVLPSKNEGLPLVCVEALKCGVNVVGSDVGGISEVIGNENVISLGPRFQENFAKRVVDILLLGEKSFKSLAKEFDLSVAVNKELNIYRSLIIDKE